jgi:maltose alpha-D-glucosyltransferase/alpha-amylase
MSDQPLWYKNAVFYEVYVRAFCDSNGDGHGDLRGLMGKLDYLKELGVDCLWLLPIYSSPLLDDGYDIADYYNILPEYGTPEDFKALLEAAHQKGMRVIADLVLNHTSDQHPWFKSASSSRENRYRNYYVWSDDDRKYSGARIIFLDTEKSNWAWSEPTRQFYWHRFYSSQPDLNYDNPEVQEVMLRVADYWLSLGVDGFRADAVPYLFEREGTNCENLPETHDYLKRLRSFIDERHPGKILLCEANQWPEDVRPYFGDGDEFHMGFHFPVMPRIYMALRQGNTETLHWILERTPPIPEECQWCLFLRNHDELTLEMVTEEERQWMWQEYAPDMRMRLNLGIRRRLAPLLDNDRRKIELANSLLFTLPGSPTIYYGDEIGMGDNIGLFDRNGVRTPMQWDETPTAGFSNASPDHFYAPVIATEPYNPAYVNVADQHSDPGSLWNTMRRMIAIRKQHPAFGWGDFEWATPGSPEVAAYWRTHSGERLLVVNNLSAEPQSVAYRITDAAAIKVTNLWSGETFSAGVGGMISLKLAPYQYLWLKQATKK